MATGANATPLDFPNKKRKRSRWNQDLMDQKTVIPGMPTVIPPGLTREQEKAYIVQLQIEYLTRKLHTGDLGIPPNPEDRSPSPEPIYNREGKRLNTREFRARKKLEEERHTLITEMVVLNPDFKPPADYKSPATQISDKVMIPQDEYPEINFMGLLIGPRGNTLKNIEKECDAKIMIRGKGSVKEGKVGRKDRQMLPGENEPLYALVTANTMENVKKAVEQIRNILKQGIETPEDQNDLRKMQLREFARLNGTLREDDNRILRPWQSSETRSITNTTVCTKCGGAGHIASDCKFLRPGDPQSAQDKVLLDKEYLSLMAELCEAPVPASAGSASGPAATPLASTLRPAVPANNPLLPSLMSTTRSRPPWVNSGPSENRPYHGMHVEGPGGPGGGPHNFPHLLPRLTGRYRVHSMQHNPNGPPLPLDAATTITVEPGAPPTWAPWPSSYGSVPRKYACGFWDLSPTSSKRYDASPTTFLWPSSPMAAAAFASPSPAIQQQYPLAMAAKYYDYHQEGWHRVHPTMATAAGSCGSFFRSPSDAKQPHYGVPAPQGPATSALPGPPSPPPPPPPPPPPGSPGLMYAPPPPPPPPKDPSNFVTKMGMGVAGMPPAPPPPPPQN